MTVTVSAGAPPYWVLLNKSGAAAIGGTMTASRAVAPQELKAIYADPSGTTSLENPLDITDAGFFQKIYFMVDEPYQLVFKDANGEEIFTDANYTPNSSGGSPPVTVDLAVQNHVTNPQFNYPLPIPGTLPVGPIEICQDWFFQKSNANAADTISMVPFNPGDNESPTLEGTPQYYPNYVCTAVGAGGETFKDFYTTIDRVAGFAKALTSHGLALISPTSSTVELIARQFFGTGGTPSATVNTSLGIFNLTPSWQKFTAVSQAIPSIAGKSLGSNGDDALILIIRMPLNAICNVGFTNSQWVSGANVPVMEHATTKYSGAFVKTNNIPFPTASNVDYLLTVNADAITQSWQPAGRSIGEIKFMSYQATEDSGDLVGFLFCDGRALSRTTYAALFGKIGTLWGAGDGSTTFNLPDCRGRTLISTGTGAGLTPRTVGQRGGEETHLQTLAELVGHVHVSPDAAPFMTASVLSATYSGSSPLPRPTPINNNATQSAGGGEPFNVMQPWAAMPMYIRYKY
jgi:microcystin-dependent protein